MKSFELFEHTADIGLRVFGKTPRELFSHAGSGLAEITTESARVEPFGEELLVLHAPDLQELFLCWLKELLFRFSARLNVFCSVDFDELTLTRLAARVRFGRFDPQRHEQRYEVKAVTHHGYRLRQTKDGWIAEVILDV